MIETLSDVLDKKVEKEFLAFCDQIDSIVTCDNDNDRRLAGNMIRIHLHSKYHYLDKVLEYLNKYYLNEVHLGSRTHVIKYGYGITVDEYMDRLIEGFKDPQEVLGDE